MPDRQEDKILVKYLELNHVRVVQLTFRQDANEVEGKTTLQFKNLSGATITQLRVLIEEGNTSYVDSIVNQSIVSIGALQPAADYQCALPFHTSSLQDQRLKVVLLSTGEASQLISGCYRNVYATFADRNKLVQKYGTVNGYVAADGETLFRLKDGASYYEVSGSFVDTTFFVNGFLKKKVTLGDSLAGPVALDTVQAAQRFDLSGGGLSFRVKLGATLSDSTRYFSIKTKKL